MECCHVLTMWVNVVVSFNYTSRILGGNVTDCRGTVRWALIENLELFCLVCGLVDCPPYLSWHWEGGLEADSVSWLSVLELHQ